MKRLRLRAPVLLLVCAAMLLSCSSPRRHPAPPQTDDGWHTASLEEVGIRGKEIDKAVDLIREGTYRNVHSMVIVKDGKLVFEQYFGGYAWSYSGDQHRGAFTDFGIDTLHNLASVTKSFTSTLIGIGLDQGLIDGVDDTVWSYFPDYAHLSDERKDAITLEHLLTMTSGLEWNEMGLSYSNRSNDLIQLFWISDPIEYILSKPVVHDPGTRWYYNGGGTNLLGEVIREATGLRMDAFAGKCLFEPLGITEYEWDHINPEMIHASGNLRLRPRDMAKLGYLFMSGGIWQGERVVSEKWVEESTKGHVDLGQSGAYGYQWWLKTYSSGSTTVDSFYAAGWGGQKIIAFPGLDLVVVFTGGNYVEEDPTDEIVARHVLPAVR